MLVTGQGRFRVFPAIAQSRESYTDCVLGGLREDRAHAAVDTLVDHVKRAPEPLMSCV